MSKTTVSIKSNVSIKSKDALSESDKRDAILMDFRSNPEYTRVKILRKGKYKCSKCNGTGIRGVDLNTAKPFYCKCVRDIYLNPNIKISKLEDTQNPPTIESKDNQTTVTQEVKV